MSGAKDGGAVPPIYNKSLPFTWSGSKIIDLNSRGPQFESWQGYWLLAPLCLHFPLVTTGSGIAAGA